MTWSFASVMTCLEESNSKTLFSQQWPCCFSIAIEVEGCYTLTEASNSSTEGFQRRSWFGYHQMRATGTSRKPSSVPRADYTVSLMGYLFSELQQLLRVQGRPPPVSFFLSIVPSASAGVETVLWVIFHFKKTRLCLGGI